METGKKITIIGCSIAGSALALLLAKAGMKVRVFEQKPAAEIGNKVCANVVTSSFLNLVKKLGINPAKITKKRFSNAQFYSESNFVNFPVNDYEIDRKKLLQEIIKKAEKNGAKFFFNSRFADLEKTISGYNILLKNKGKKIIETADFIIGADGALSGIAKKSGLWQNRKFWLAIQAKIPKIKRKIPNGTYEIFFIRKFGYYSYVFPSAKCFVIGTVSNPKNVKQEFSNFLKFLEINKCRIESALIPLPKKINIKKGNIFLAGDAACQVKFTGGGIVPAIESAFAVMDIIIGNKNKRMNSLNKEIMLHQLITKVLGKMSDNDFNMLFEIAKKNKTVAASRDELRKFAFKLVLKNPSLLKFLPKLL